MPPTNPEPDVVYHYTTMGAMMRIVETASIWATSINYLNDISEGEHFRKLICNRIQGYRQTHTLGDETIFDQIQADGGVGFETRPFVASFSQDGDSLPQWRSYCPNGNGVSIGFSVDCLKRAAVRLKEGSQKTRGPSTAYKPVTYIDVADEPLLDAEIDFAVEESTHLAGPSEKGKTIPIADCFSFIIERLACFKKDPSFSNEKEYRLVVDGVIGHRACIEFRPTRSTLVPYIPVVIPRERSRYTDEMKETLSTFPYSSALMGRWDFVDHVIIGPTTNGALSLQAVEAFFRKQSMHVDVKLSKVPYRDW